VIGDAATRERILAERLDVLRYADEEGRPTDAYPDNPNGSEGAIAGLSDPSGRVLGLMPHPEACLTRYHHPNWPRLLRDRPDLPEEGAGLALVRNVVAAAANGDSP